MNEGEKNMTMKAGVVYAMNDLRVSDVEKPVPARDEVLVQVKYCGVWEAT